MSQYRKGRAVCGESRTYGSEGALWTQRVWKYHWVWFATLLHLIALFAYVSFYLIIIGLNFIGLSYLIVYIGAVFKRTIRLFLSNHAAWVKISLYKVLLIINILIHLLKFLIVLYEAEKKLLVDYILNFFLYSSIYSTSNKVSPFLNGVPRSQKYSLINKSNKRYYSTYTYADLADEDFLRWFSGFSDAEGNFSINFYKNKLGNTSSVSFKFNIELHVDDKDTLNIIKKRLNLGNDIAVYGNSCKFTVTHPEEIYKLIEIFDKYNLNTTKYLDYLDFKKAFKIYQERIKTVQDEEIFNNILNIKEGMNSNRTSRDFPVEHNICITDYWLLGLIEGEGSFYLDRSKMEPIFSITQSNIQHSLMEAIKNYLLDRLGFDKYSMFKLNNSSVIDVITGKAINNSKPLSVLRIKNTNVLTNYLIPYFNEMEFLSKKGLDYREFKIICKAIYDGAHRTEEIKELIIKLSYTMNNYRLSNNSSPKEDSSLSKEELGTLLNGKSTVIHLDDGRQIDNITRKEINRRWTNCVYEIIKGSGEVILASTLNEAGEILNVDFRTVRRNLDSLSVASLEEGDNGKYFTEIKGNQVRRVAVFYPK